MSFRFLADMGISLKTVEWLRSHGHDIVHLREQNLQCLPEHEILEKAYIEKRILLTMDLDFGYLVSMAPKIMPLVIIFRLSDERSIIVNQRLSAILPVLSVEKLSGTIISVGDHNMRVRKVID